MKCVFPFISILITILSLAACGSPETAPSEDGPMDARLGEAFNLPGGEEANIQIEDLSIKFVELVEDSRCPLDVSCVWEGVGIITLELQHDEAPTARIEIGTLAPEDVVTYLGYRFHLDALEPYPQSTNKANFEAYLATLLVEKP